MVKGLRKDIALVSGTWMAAERGDTSELVRLLEMLRSPFAEQPEHADYSCCQYSFHFFLQFRRKVITK